MEPSRTVYCQEHHALEDIETVRRIDKAGGEPNSKGQLSRIVYGTSTTGCNLAFMSSLPWKKRPQ